MAKKSVKEKVKEVFTKAPATTAPQVLISGTKMHVMQDMRVGVNDGTPFYVLKFELVTDLNGMQAVISCIDSDGSINVQVTDGGTQSSHDDKPE